MTSYRIADLALRCLLSCAVVTTMLALTIVAAKVQATLALSQASLRSPAPIFAAVTPPITTSPKAPAMWPRFPRNDSHSTHVSQLNGVKVITESFQTSVSAAGVIDFYRPEMVARGWVDTTEGSMGLNPDTKSSKALQDERFLELYKKVMGTQLILSKSGWTMRVSATDGEGGKTRVDILAAATSSLNALGANIVGSSGKGNFSNGTPLEYVESFGGTRYKTSLWTQAGHLETAFDTSLLRLKGLGWQPVNIVPSNSTGGRMAWLERSNHTAALTAAPLPQSHRCAITLTEMIPE